jgi:hypothetical protein
VSQLKAFSLLTEDLLDLGPKTEDLDAILGLAETMAPHPDLIVFVDGPALQKWSTT